MELIEDPQVVLALLSAGVVLEQTSAEPQRFALSYRHQSVPVSGGVIQQLQVRRSIRPASTVSGHRRFVVAK